MNNFKAKKIRHSPPRRPLSPAAKRGLTMGIGALLVVFFLYYIGLQALHALSGTRIFHFFSGLAAKNLEVDERNHTNILLLGVGGEGHDGGDLTDTMLIASLNHNTNGVTMISIPRDLYLEQSKLGGTRINRLYEQGKARWGASLALDYVQDTIHTTFELPIHYSVKVDFTAFKEVVDSVGGIDVIVTEAIRDDTYPDGETYGFEPFYIEAGLQHLDGETALKYVRTRHSGAGDYDRSKRQQEVLLALKNRAAEYGKLHKTSFLKNLYYSLNDHVESNMELREMLSLAEFAAGWKDQTISPAVISDEPTAKGGFLYTPMRELYGGASVSRPVGDNFSLVNKYIDFMLYGPGSTRDFPIAVMNGTKKPGYAGTVKELLHRFGFSVNRFGNARSQKLTTTTWYVLDTLDANGQQILDFAKSLIPGIVVTTLPTEYLADPGYTGIKIILELGPDVDETVKKLVGVPWFPAAPTATLSTINATSTTPLQ